MATAITPTTASAAVSLNAEQITLASVSNVTVGGPMFVDGEGMMPLSISGTTVRVKRGQFSTARRAHASGVTVWPGLESYFKQGIPRGRGDAALEQYLPRLVFSGNDGAGRIFTLGGPDGTQWIEIALESEGRRDIVREYRERVAIADVNAGATLLAALVGFRYRLVDAAMISVGGAAATATTVDLVATLSASTRKLLAVAVAALTQSALVRAGASNATILADGASFTVNDRNTALTASKTGSDVATATHIDYLLNYVIE